MEQSGHLWTYWTQAVTNIDKAGQYFFFVVPSHTYGDEYVRIEDEF